MFIFFNNCYSVACFYIPAFIVDATAAPIASITPVSAWVGFEIDLIQQELNRYGNTCETALLALCAEFSSLFIQNLHAL